MKLGALLILALVFSSVPRARAQTSELEQAVASGFAALCLEVCKTSAAICQNELKSGELSIYSQITLDAMRDKGLLKGLSSHVTRIDVLNIQLDEASLKCTGSVRYTTDKPLTGNMRTSAPVAFAPDTVRLDLHSCLAAIAPISVSNTLPAGDAAIMFKERRGKSGIYLINRVGVYFGAFPPALLNAVFSAKNKVIKMQASRSELEKQISQAKDDDRRVVLERALSRLENAIRSESLVVAREQSQRFILNVVTPKQTPFLLLYEVNAGTPEITVTTTGTAGMTMNLTEIDLPSEMAMVATEVLERLHRLKPGPVKETIAALRKCRTVENSAIRSAAQVEIEGRIK